MKSETPMDNNAQPNNDKKPYETPQLRKFGNIAEVTQTGNIPAIEAVDILGSN